MSMFIMYLVGMCVLLLCQKDTDKLCSHKKMLYTMITPNTYIWGKSLDEMFDITFCLMLERRSSRFLTHLSVNLLSKLTQGNH